MVEPIIPRGTGWDKNTERLSDADIQIGAVEIKDHNSDLRADVVTRSDGNNALCIDVLWPSVSAFPIIVRDGNGSIFADVKSDGVDNALVVTQNSQPLPDGAATEATLSSVKSNTDNLIKTSSTPLIQTVTLTNANTEYSVDLPIGTRRFSMQPRQRVDVRFAFQSGKVAGPTEPYATMKAGAPYTEWDLHSPTFTIPIYFASSTAGTVVEIISWA